MLNYRNKVKGYLFTPFLLLVFLSSYFFAESQKDSYKKIIERKELIISASKIFDINSRYLAAVIYTERTKNYDWTDEAFDVVMARVGKNSSIGFCQVKLKTAYFISKQLVDSTSSYYPGGKYKGILKIHKNPYRLIDDLQNDSLNILYAAAYLRIIQSYWKRAGYSIDERPEIIGSLYQLGLFHKNGEPREPHFNPKANTFGKKTLDSIHLFADFGKMNMEILFK